MNRRLSGKEFSLNAQVGEDGDEWQDWLVDKELDHDLKFAHQEEMEQRKDLLKNSIQVLNEREREILYSRRLNDNPTTLEDLSKKYKISRERVRQIENKALFSICLTLSLLILYFLLRSSNVVGLSFSLLEYKISLSLSFRT